MEDIVKIRALHACNGGGKPMVPGKVYSVPGKIPVKDAIYLINTKKAVAVEKDAKDLEVDKMDKAPTAPTPPPPGGKGINSKSGLK